MQKGLYATQVPSNKEQRRCRDHKGSVLQMKVEWGIFFALLIKRKNKTSDFKNGETNLGIKGGKGKRFSRVRIAHEVSGKILQLGSEFISIRGKRQQSVLTFSGPLHFCNGFSEIRFLMDFFFPYFTMKGKTMVMMLDHILCDATFARRPRGPLRIRPSVLHCWKKKHKRLCS